MRDAITQFSSFETVMVRCSESDLISMASSIEAEKIGDERVASAEKFGRDGVVCVNGLFDSLHQEYDPLFNSIQKVLYTSWGFQYTRTVEPRSGPDSSCARLCIDHVPEVPETNIANKRLRGDCIATESG